MGQAESKQAHQVLNLLLLDQVPLAQPCLFTLLSSNGIENLVSLDLYIFVSEAAYVIYETLLNVFVSLVRCLS